MEWKSKTYDLQFDVILPEIKKNQFLTGTRKTPTQSRCIY
jgi:hypothetical protein